MIPKELCVPGLAYQVHVPVFALTDNQALVSASNLLPRLRNSTSGTSFVLPGQDSALSALATKLAVNGSGSAIELIKHAPLLIRSVHVADAGQLIVVSTVPMDSSNTWIIQRLTQDGVLIEQKDVRPPAAGYVISAATYSRELGCVVFVALSKREGWAAFKVVL
jgi:hypothetical protein